MVGLKKTIQKNDKLLYNELYDKLYSIYVDITKYQINTFGETIYNCEYYIKNGFKHENEIKYRRAKQRKYERRKRYE